MQGPLVEPRTVRSITSQKKHDVKNRTHNIRTHDYDSAIIFKQAPVGRNRGCMLPVRVLHVRSHCQSSHAPFAKNSRRGLGTIKMTLCWKCLHIYRKPLFFWIFLPSKGMIVFDPLYLTPFNNCGSRSRAPFALYFAVTWHPWSKPLLAYICSSSCCDDDG